MSQLQLFNPKLICLAGGIGSGKSEVARHLEKKYGFAREPFSKPLKQMLHAFGLTKEHTDGVLKNKPCDILGGKTPRHAMQTLGTEWGRDQITSNIWVRHWAARVLAHRKSNTHVVEEGTRFINEIKACRALGGALIYICRANGNKEADAHVSEQGDLMHEANYVIQNTKDIPALHKEIEDIMRFMGVKPL